MVNLKNLINLINFTNFIMKGKVVSVSLGPGDPELITIKALKALQEADEIYCPGTQDKAGTVKSYSRDIIAALPVDTGKITVFHVPMSKDRTHANRAYDSLCMEVAAHVTAGKTVAVTAEGDSGFYSSGNYMFEKLSSMHIPISVVAGVPAFIAAASVSGLHIVKQEEKLVVLPGKATSSELYDLLTTNHVVVIMKLSQCTREIHEFIRLYPDHDYHYYQNVGTPNQLHVTDRIILLGMEFPYFSLMIIRPPHKNSLPEN